MPDATPADPADFRGVADRTTEAGIADETAAYDEAIPTEGGDDEAESEAQPS